MLQRIIETRGFTRGMPRKPVPSPTGDHVYFLRSEPKSASQAIHVFDIESGTFEFLVGSKQLTEIENVSAEEQARKERQRETEGGITHYTVSDDGQTILIPYSGDVFLFDVAGKRVRRLTNTPEAEIDPHLSPDGEYLAFVRNRQLVVRHLQSGREIAPVSAFATGVAEFVAQEEMDRDTGHWWSPDSRYVAFTEVDSREVPDFNVPNLTHPEGQGRSGPYPKAGETNAWVRVGVLDVSSLQRETTASSQGPLLTEASWLPAFAEDYEYLARVHWGPNARYLWTQTQPRDQKRLDLHRYDVTQGTMQLVLQEKDDAWINLHHDFHLLSDGEEFVWSSERSGHRHLEVIDTTGERQRQLTSGSWQVEKVLHVDEPRREVTFCGYKDDPTELQIYKVGLDGGDVQRQTRERGWHVGFFHKTCHDVYVDEFSDTDIPKKFYIRDHRGGLLGVLPSVAVEPDEADLGPRPELLRTTTSKGVRLDIFLTRPPGLDSSEKAPLILYVYGGPHAQQVRRMWNGERGLIDAWLAKHGYFVARIDGRGVWARGHEQERIYYRHMGEHELQDQVAGIRYLLQQVPQIDGERLGIWGWSYGGYMTLMAMMKEPRLFKAGVSVAPVVDWRGYDTHYTERYMGTPQDNLEGYEASSVLTYAENLEGHLTLVHGASDDNVHLRESMILVDKLVTLGKQFDLMIYPGTHMIQSLEERTHLYEMIWRAFEENL